MFAYFIPAVLEYYDHMEEVEKKRKAEKSKSMALRPEIIFVGAAYFSGVIFTTLPGSDFCELGAKEADDRINQALFIMVLVSAGFLVIFNLFFFA